ncbi:WbqC family protein [Atlantibacter sp.]|uniref:WbqC family protein n=1 Tax=Atlantibacter sp. TaxID=1903473 RepID=UPI00289F3D38|nr:WbqC family protein [Atlantibacter sp.]
MNIGIMQPYLFPWIGYFQLIYQSDLFVLYDDACFIKQGYINRNSILCAGQAQRFTIPVPGASSHKRISELCFSDQVTKIVKTVEQNYSKAPFFRDVMPLFADVLFHQERNITTCCQRAIEAIFNYLGLERYIICSSELDYDRSENAENKVIGMCKALKANTYVNSTGGRHLYQADSFAAEGITLRFLQANNTPYSQGEQDFVPNLSIIDVLMHCEPQQVIKALKNYSYVD